MRGLLAATATAGMDDAWNGEERGEEAAGLVTGGAGLGLRLG